MRISAANIPNLTPLRGIAALLVIIFHFEDVINARFISEDYTMIVRKSYLMVDLFFVMSGFIMLHVYGESFNKTIRWDDFRKFLKARFARLYPLHFFTLLLFVILFYISDRTVNDFENPTAIVTNLLLIHSFGIQSLFNWNVPSWSISAEWWSYMAFPVLALLLSKNKKIAVPLLLVLATVIYIAILYYLPRVNYFDPKTPTPHNLDVTYDYGFLRGLAGFIMGMITYTVYQQESLYKFFGKDIIGLMSVGLALFTLHIGINDALYIPVFMLLVLTVAANKGFIFKIFQLKPLQYIGDISYSIYMIHLLVLFLVFYPLLENMGYTNRPFGENALPFWTGLGVCSLFITIVIAISSLTYYGIEKPCRKWINKKFA